MSIEQKGGRGKGRWATGDICDNIHLTFAGIDFRLNQFSKKELKRDKEDQ
jgi:hypothetical protein